MPNPKYDNILDIVLARPWWVSLAIAAIAYCAWRLVPPLAAGNPELAELTAGVIRVAPPLSIMFAAVVPVALMSKIRRRLLAATSIAGEASTDCVRRSAPE
jgi:hypothetical protein